MNSPQDTRGCLDLVDSMPTVEFDAERELFRAEYDRTRDSVTLAVVALVATVLDEEPDHLTPLYSAIDVDAFEGLIRETTNTPRGREHISFNYEGFEVTVFDDGKLEADPLESTYLPSQESMKATEREATSDEDFGVVLQEQRRRVLAGLDEEKTLDATPIIRHDESLSCEEYLTLVYEFHHVHLPELQSNDLVEFDRQEDEVTRGAKFEKNAHRSNRETKAERKYSS